MSFFGNIIADSQLTVQPVQAHRFGQLSYPAFSERGPANVEVEAAPRMRQQRRRGPDGGPAQPAGPDTGNTIMDNGPLPTAGAKTRPPVTQPGRVNATTPRVQRKSSRSADHTSNPATNQTTDHPATTAESPLPGKPTDSMPAAADDTGRHTAEATTFVQAPIARSHASQVSPQSGSAHPDGLPQSDIAADADTTVSHTAPDETQPLVAKPNHEAEAKVHGLRREQPAQFAFAAAPIKPGAAVRETSQTTDVAATPDVRIGQINVVVEGPSRPDGKPAPNRTSDNLSSRLFLRTL